MKEMYYWMVLYLKKIPTNDMPQFNAYLLICLLMFANIGSIFVIICASFHIDIKSLTVNYEVVGIVSGLSIMIPTYFFLFAKRTEIEKKYDQLPQKRKLIGIILFWIYSIVSIPLFFILNANLSR